MLNYKNCLFLQNQGDLKKNHTLRPEKSIFKRETRASSSKKEKEKELEQKMINVFHEIKV